MDYEKACLEVTLFSIVLTGITTGACASDLEFDTWQSGEFVDEYGDPMGEGYIKTHTKGVFSNSATANSICGVTMLVSEDSRVGLFLYNYGWGNAKYFSGKIQMKNAAGEKLYCSSDFGSMG